MQRVLVIVNPISGGGRAAAASMDVEHRLKQEGFLVRRLATERGPTEDWLDGPLSESDALVVMGGDGAVRSAATASARTGVPLCTLPYGTENLFARRFGMSRDLGRLVARLRARTTRRVDLGEGNREPFLSMCSVGFDASVVHDLAEARVGAISKRAYAKPILRQMLSWRAPQLEVRLEGTRWDLPGPGFLVVGNSSAYAARLDPAAMARDDDGLLDACFFPCHTAFGVAGWAIACWLRMQSKKNLFRHARAKSIHVRASNRLLRYQMDGDRPNGPQDVEELDLAVTPAAVPVLVGSEK